MSHSTAFQLSNPEGLYDPSGNAYSHVAEVHADSRLLFIAGQGGEDRNGQLSPLFAEQARQALANLEIALASKGASLAHVFKLTLLIVEHSEMRLHEWVAEADRAWGRCMKPTCTLIPVPRLALDGMLVEIEAVAAV
ncbi:MULTISPECIES: RidA family protein [Pseudomonas]|uniref:RidA family protein n=2 Tax=Pseudomonas TaxID=286 RepID=A0A0B5KBQ5_PSEDL|nr:MULTISPECIES: RidA family protein [Pseudomonas]MCK2119036.1 RidA family protein [Pseudomonas sp. PNPG3]AHZ77330.1 endoribonuclease L-PSP [Pseudomonas putida]AJG13855.1 YjgF family translation initiation inhibitor [Pseudomonas plecoglossicida]ESW36864.1 YjgF family translation initiation inhibitor [Pseudomonas taiwanensis SJ9]MBF8790634.1 RidA family protein [Pseudomonas asiatica]